MASVQFIDIPEIGGLFNSKSARTNEPLVYKIPVTYLQNLSSGTMIIDSCSNIVLQARNNNHVRVNNKMGIGLDPSSAYSLHVLGDTCISGNLISNNFTDLSSKYYSLQSSLNELSNNNYILNTNINTISYNLYNILENFIFGTGYYGTITLVNNSIYDISFRVSWYPSYLSQEQEYTPNYVSVNSINGSTNVNISNTNRLASRNSNFFLNIKSNTNSFFNERLLDYSYVNFNNSLVTSISSEFFDNDSKHRITVNVSNFDNIENIPITIDYNPLYKGFFGTFTLGNKTSGARFDYSYNYISISGTTFNSIIQTLSGSDFSNILISSNSRLANQTTPLNLSLVIAAGYDISINALATSIIGISNNILTSPNRTFGTSTINYNYNIIPLTSYLVNGTIGLSFEMYRTGFFGTFVLGNKTSGARFDYSYNYISISGSNVNSIIQTLSGSDFSNILISSNSRLAYADSSLNLSLVIYNGYDISINALVTSIIGISNNILTSPNRTFGTSTINYNYNIIPLTSYLVNGTIGLSFEMYRTGFFGTFALGNKTSGARFDYSYNYLSISGSNINSIIQTLSGVTLINNSISGANRLANQTTPLNLSLVIFNGYDISMNALSANSIVGISNNILTSPNRTFGTSTINYNYNIIPLTSYLVKGIIGLSFEMYRTGFFGTFIIGNKTVGSTFDYSYNYLSISGSNVTSRFTNFTFTLITQISPPTSYEYYFGINATKFAKTTDNNTIKVVFGSPDNGFVSFWNGTTISNELIELPMPTNYARIGVIIGIDNIGQYIVSGGTVSRTNLSFGGRIWSTTPPYNSTLINYPGFPSQIGSNFVMSVHISGNGQRVFVGSFAFQAIYVFSHTDLSLTQIGGVIICNVSTTGNSFSLNGFASDNSGNYLITSAYKHSNNAGFIVLYHYNDSTWVQSGNGFSGTAANDYFGYSIDMNCGSGEWCCAGAPTSSTPYVKIYKRVNTTWTEFQTLTGTNSSGFGTSVSFNESGSSLHVTTTNAETFYYTRPNNSEQFSLTSTIPIQQPTSNEYKQCVSTNSSGNQVILVKSSTTAASAYFFDNINITSGLQTVRDIELINNIISSDNRVAFPETPLNLFVRPQLGYDISTNTNSGLDLQTNNGRLFDSSSIYYNYKIIPLTSQLVGGTIGLSFEMYRTGFFGTFTLGNKTSGARFDYSYNYISISGSNVNSIIQTLSGSDFSNILISSNSRLANQTTPLNLSLVIYNGYDISINALATSIIGISNNILTSPNRTFGTSTINYNYNIIPLTSYLVNGNIGLSFEMYRTGFFGTFALGNKTSGARFDYSYNYISISGSNVNSIIQTLSGSDFSNILISSNSRLANQNTPLNLSLVIYDGYDISINALSNSIIGISNNILSATRTFNTSNNINYNYNIIPLSSYLVNGTIGLSFEMYRTGFFGNIILTNNLGSSVISNYNYVSISGDNTNYLNIINNTSSNTRTISGELRLRYAISQINLTLKKLSSSNDIYEISSNQYNISGGTITSNTQNVTIEDTLVQSLSRTSATSSVAMSLSGDVIVIGASSESATINGTTYVGRGNVYIWIRSPIGTGSYSSSTIAINITLDNVNIGSSVAVSGNGNIIVIGSLGFHSILVYNRITSTLFNSNNTQPISRTVVSTNYDGSIIGVGYPTSNSNSGSVILYRNNGTSLSEIYTYLSTSEFRLLGVSIAVSSDGRVVVVSGARNLEASYKGVILLFKNNASPGSTPNYQVSWTLGLFFVQIYNTLDFYINISINYNATRIVLGVPEFIINFTSNVGRVYIYEVNSTHTSAIGESTLFDPVPVINHKFGYAVALNYDGSRLIVSQYGSQQIKVYNYNNTSLQFTLQSTISNMEASYLACSQTELGLLYVATLTNLSVDHIRNFGVYENYTYNILPNINNLVNGIIGLSFEMYRTGVSFEIYGTGFFGNIVLTNNLGSTIDYSYNYITLGDSTTYVPSTSITNTSSNTRNISGELRLRDASSQIAMNIRTASSVADISYTINGGTINNFVINSISPYKYVNFNILPNVNNLVNGTLTLNSITNPQPPTNLLANIVENRADISWNAPTFNGGSAILSYSIFNNGTLDTQNITSTFFTKTNNTSANIVYNFTVKAINSVGSSLSSNSVAVTIPGVAPSTGGWYGSIIIQLQSFRTDGFDTDITYTIYKGSTTLTPVLVENQTIYNNVRNSVESSLPHSLSINDRLQNSSSTFLVIIQNFNGGDINLSLVTNGTASYNPSYSITPGTIQNDVIIKFSISPP
jgi:hypothetical protein